MYVDVYVCNVMSKFVYEVATIYRRPVFLGHMLKISLFCRVNSQKDFCLFRPFARRIGWCRGGNK